MNVLVSVVIPTYGRAVNLLRAIDSVLNQTYDRYEIIVVDDNDPESESRKSTENLMVKYTNNKRVRYIKHTENRNGAAARNTGVKYSSGHYIFFLDDDDEFMPNRLSEHVMFCVEHSAPLSYCLTNKFIGHRFISQSKYSKSGNLIFDTLCSLVDFNSSSIVVSRSLFDDIGGFNEAFIRNQDYEFVIRCMSRADILCFHSVLVIRHLDSKINHPDFDKYAIVRKSFLVFFESEVLRLSFLKRLSVYSFYNFDLFCYGLRKRCIFRALKHFLLIFPTPFFIFNVTRKIMTHLFTRYVRIRY